MLEELRDALKPIEKCCDKRQLIAYVTDVSKGEVRLTCENCRTKHIYFRKETKVDKFDSKLIDEQLYEEIAQQPRFLKESKDGCQAHFRYFVEQIKLDRTKLEEILK